MASTYDALRAEQQRATRERVRLGAELARAEAAEAAAVGRMCAHPAHAFRNSPFATLLTRPDVVRLVFAALPASDALFVALVCRDFAEQVHHIVHVPHYYCDR